ncbi:MAG: ABC transporter permease, partial [Clostridia bacterium]|nr:ABC transporter permease [Clostridia bacterium]
EYDELLGKEFNWYPTDSVFKNTPYGATYTSDSQNISDELKADGMKLKVVGILTPKDNVSYGCLSSGIYYTEALTNHILESNKNSEFINYISSDESMLAMGPKVYQIPKEDGSFETVTIPAYTIIYTYSYLFDDPTTPENENKLVNNAMGYIIPSSSSDMMSSMMGMGGSGGSSDPNESTKKSRDLLVRYLGGNDLANNVLIYPKSFDDKNLVTDYLDRWNDTDNVKVINVNGKDIKAEDRISVTYTDTLELIINLINTMIDVVTYGLVAFTSVSLVVSTVMIGIITYVSVVERIKEIGVIRSLGGRKKDVRHLFNAETFIIGLLAGLIGVGFTYFASAIVNLILKPIIGYASIAALPIGQAILLVALSVGLTCISGLIPASSAAKKDPVIALRTE